MAGIVMGRRERKKLQSKQTILTAAVKQFMEKGVKETSIADIMSEAELGIGTFYNYFESKEALLWCLLDQFVTETRRLKERLAAEEAGAAEMLEAVVCAAAERLEANRFVLPLFLSAADRSPLSRPGRETRPRMAPAFQPVFNDAVRYGQTRGAFREDVSAEAVTEMLYAIFHAASSSEMSCPFVENVRMKLRLLLSGLAAR